MTKKKKKTPPAEVPVSYKTSNTLGLKKAPSEEISARGGVKKVGQRSHQSSQDAVAACRKWLETHPPRNRKQVQPKQSFQELLAFLSEVYGESRRRPPSRRASPGMEHLPTYTILGKVAPNLSAFPIDKKSRRLIPTHSGIEAQIDEICDDAVDMFIGLDFGTSCSKVVIRDSNRREHYAVPFFEVGAGNPFLLPSHVLVDADGRYFLDGHNVPSAALNMIRDLKLTLMQDPRNVLYMVHATAYLALVTRHARGWLLSTFRDTYKNTEITWGLNLGLPAERSEDEFLSRRFQALALAAANLAGHPGEITRETAAHFITLATRALDNESPEELGFTIWPDMIGVYPEIAAQVVGFVESERWDADSRPFVTLIDIGAGTVDVSFFSIEKRGERRFQFFQNKVAENGVMNLHRERIGWLRLILHDEIDKDPEVGDFLDGLFRPTDRLSGIPESVASYLTGVRLSEGNSIDEQFFDKRYRYQVFTEVISPVHRCRVPTGDHWLSLPVFICGGGSRMPIYGRIIKHLNSISGINWLQAKQYRLTKPSKLIAPGLSDEDYDRLSVAYGLSFESVGKIIRSHEIEDYVPTVQSGVEIEAPGKEVC